MCRQVKTLEKEKFIKRLIELRMSKGVSARDMSLSIGQSENYINHIENGKSFPSMAVFFYICEYFNLTPGEFFNYEQRTPTKLQSLNEACKSLNGEQIDLFISLAKNLK